MDPKNQSNSAEPRLRQLSKPAAGGNGMNSKMVWGIGGLLVVVALVVGVMMWKQMSANEGVKTGQYQALFLSNGQVYFGKLTNVNDKYVSLSNIYYLQVQQALQNGGGSKTQPKVSLAKLGSELHGPEDQMYVNRDQVLFWENLKDDGKVVQAIKENQK